jgi:transposase
VGITPSTPFSRNRKIPIPHDRELYCHRHRIENAFAKLKDWRRAAIRYDRRAHTFQSIIPMAIAVIFLLT